MARKRAELTAGSLFLYLLIVVFAAFVLIFGYKYFFGLKAQQNVSELALFSSSLNNKFEKIASGSLGGKGSVFQESFSLPAGIDSVCFVDRSAMGEFDRFAYAGLSDQLKLYDDENLFFGNDFNAYFPKKAEHFKTNENPICVAAKDGNLKLKLSNLGNAVLIEGEAEDVKKNCQTLVYNAEPDKAADVAFVGDQYASVEDFKADVNTFVNEIFLGNPAFNADKGKMNFYLIPDKFDFRCKIGDWIECDESLVRQAASGCPADFIIALVPRSKVLDILKPVRSAALGNVMFVNTADNKNVVLHEFGHSFGNLGDEYVDDAFYSKSGFSEDNALNCDTAACSEWENVNGTGCFTGCSLSKFYRPTQSSVMRTLDDNNFGPWNSNLIDKRFKAYD